jgi:type IV fimbrial biogenesis protein FimT
MNVMANKSNGFTLLEIFIALAILAITTAIAAPSFSEIISNNRISGSTNDFIGTLQLAKAESAARVAPVTVCKKNTSGSACVASGDWRQGWIVFSDSNGNAVVDAGDTVILNHEALDSRITFDGTAGVGDSITYNPSGTTSIAGTQVLIMCDDRGFAESAKGILVTITGRGNVMKATDTGQTACL